MTKIINLFSGPSAGKSSVAGGLFWELKRRHKRVDAPYEFPKVLAWDKNEHAIKDQFFVIGNQHRGIARSWGSVDYIIMDSPLLLALIYKDMYSDNTEYPTSFYGKEFDAFIISLHKKYDNLNIFLERDESKFEESGRYQNLEQSKIIDGKIKEMLQNLNIEYHRTPTDGAISLILQLIGVP